MVDTSGAPRLMFTRQPTGPNPEDNKQIFWGWGEDIFLFFPTISKLVPVFAGATDPVLTNPAATASIFEDRGYQTIGDYPAAPYYLAPGGSFITHTIEDAICDLPIVGLEPAVQGTPKWFPNWNGGWGPTPPASVSSIAANYPGYNNHTQTGFGIEFDFNYDAAMRAGLSFINTFSIPCKAVDDTLAVGENIQDIEDSCEVSLEGDFTLTWIMLDVSPYTDGVRIRSNWRIGAGLTGHYHELGIWHQVYTIANLQIDVNKNDYDEVEDDDWADWHYIPVGTEFSDTVHFTSSPFPNTLLGGSQGPPCYDYDPNEQHGDLGWLWWLFGGGYNPAQQWFRMNLGAPRLLYPDIPLPIDGTVYGNGYHYLDRFRFVWSLDNLVWTKL